MSDGISLNSPGFLDALRFPWAALRSGRPIPRPIGRILPGRWSDAFSLATLFWLGLGLTGLGLTGLGLTGLGIAPDRAA